MIRKIFLIVLFSSICFAQTKELSFGETNFMLGEKFSTILSKINLNKYSLFKVQKGYVLISEIANGKVLGGVTYNESDKIIEVTKDWGNFDNPLDAFNVIYYLLNQFTSNELSITTPELIQSNIKIKSIDIKNENHSVSISLYKNIIQVIETIE